PQDLAGPKDFEAPADHAEPVREAAAGELVDRAALSHVHTPWDARNRTEVSRERGARTPRAETPSPTMASKPGGLMLYDSILGTIGKTPIVRIHRLAPAHVTMYAKCEFFNPCASVKDRLAIAIIEHAERTGALAPEQTVIEATSGNTGIALAMVCAAKGYPFVATMAESFSVERRKIMRMLGARVILTPAAERAAGMVRKAEELAKKHGWFLARQFENEANPAYHRNTTGPEILADFAGKRLDYFVTGWGTGGTMTGAGQMIRLARPEVQIIATEPAAAALLSGRPFTPHKIQGWTPDFVPAVLDRSVPHRVLPVTDDEAIDAARALARSEGIFCGISSGGTFAGGPARPPPSRPLAPSSSPCCRIPASAISPRRCSRESPKAAPRNRDARRRRVRAASRLACHRADPRAAAALSPVWHRPCHALV